MATEHKAIEGGCVREGLIAEARKAGRSYINAVRRGDFLSADHAWRAGDHGVGYPYMTAAEAAAARSSFVGACR
jgi:xanthine/CO dehydrogenase XdhC/CoxF family maturation factor